MGRIGTQELLIILAIVLLLFGPKALPKLGHSLGRTLGSFRKGMNEDMDASEDETAVVRKENGSSEKAV